MSSTGYGTAAPPGTGHRPRRPPTRRNTLDAMKPFLGRLSEGTVHRRVRPHATRTASSKHGNRVATAAAGHGANPPAAQQQAALATSVADAVARGTWAAQYTDAETLRQHTTSATDEYTEVEDRLVREVNTLRRDPNAYAEVVKSEATIGYPYVLAEDLWFASDADAVHVADKVEVPESVTAALQTEAAAAAATAAGGGGRTGGGGGGGGSGSTSGVTGGSGSRRPQSSATAITVALMGISAPLTTTPATTAASNANTTMSTAATAASQSAASGTSTAAKSKRAAAADASAMAAATCVATAVEAAFGHSSPDRVLQQRLAAQSLLTMDYAAALRVPSHGVPLAEMSPSPLSAAGRGEALIEMNGTTTTVAGGMHAADRYTVSGGIAELDLAHLRLQFGRYQRRRQALFKAAEEVRQAHDKALRTLHNAWCVEDEKPAKRTGTAAGGGASGRRSMAAPRKSDASNGASATVSDAAQAHRLAIVQELDRYFGDQLESVESALMIAQDTAKRYMDGANVILDVVRALKEAAPVPPLQSCRGLSLAARETSSAVLQYPEECAVLTALSRPATLAAETLMAGMATAEQRAQRAIAKNASTPPHTETADIAAAAPPNSNNSNTTDDQGAETALTAPPVPMTSNTEPEADALNDAEENELLAACATVTRVLRHELANLAEASHEACSLMGYFSGEVRGLQAYGGGSPRMIVLRLLLGISAPHFTFRDGPMGSAKEILRQDVPEWTAAGQLYKKGLFSQLCLTEEASLETHPQNASALDGAAVNAVEPSLTSLHFCGTCHPTSLAAATHIFAESATSTTSLEKKQRTAAQRLAPLLWPVGKLIGCSWQRVYARVAPPTYDDPDLQRPVEMCIGSPTMAGLRYHNDRPLADRSVDSTEPYTVAATLLVARSFEELDLIRQNTHLPLEEVRRLVFQDLAQTAARTDRTDVLVRSDGELQNTVSAGSFTASGAAAGTAQSPFAALTATATAGASVVPMDASRQAVVELHSLAGTTLLYPASHPLVVPRWHSLSDTASSSSSAPHQSGRHRGGGAAAATASGMSTAIRSKNGHNSPEQAPPHTTTCIALRAGPPSHVTIAATLTSPQQAHLNAPLTDSRLVLVQRSEADPWIVLVLVDLAMAEKMLGGCEFLVHLFESSTPETQSAVMTPALSADVTTTATRGAMTTGADAVAPFQSIGVVRLVLSEVPLTGVDGHPTVVVGGNAARTVSTLRAQTRQQQKQQQLQARHPSTGRTVSSSSLGLNAPLATTMTGVVARAEDGTESGVWPSWLRAYLPSSSRLRSLSAASSVDAAAGPTSTTTTTASSLSVSDAFVDGQGWPTTSMDFQDRCGAVRAPLTATLRASRREPVHFSVFLPTGVDYKTPQIESLRHVLRLLDAEDAREAALEAADAMLAQRQRAEEEAAAAAAVAAAADQSNTSSDLRVGKPGAGPAGGKRASMAGRASLASIAVASTNSNNTSGAKSRASKSFSSPNRNADGARRRSSTSLLMQMREEREEAVTALRSHSIAALGCLEAALPASGAASKPGSDTGCGDATAVTTTATAAAAAGAGAGGGASTRRATSSRRSVSAAAAAPPAPPVDTALGLPKWRDVIAHDGDVHANMGLAKLRDVAHELAEAHHASQKRYQTAKALLTRELQHLEESEMPKRKGKELQKAQADAEALHAQLTDLESFMKMLAQAEHGAKAAVVQRERDQLLRRDRRARVEEELAALARLSASQAHTDPAHATTTTTTGTADVLRFPSEARQTPSQPSLDGTGRPPIAAARARRASTCDDLHRTDVRLWLVPTTQPTHARVMEKASTVMVMHPSRVVRRAQSRQSIVCLADDAVVNGGDEIVGVRYDVEAQLPEHFAGAAVLLVEGQEAVRWDVQTE